MIFIFSRDRNLILCKTAEFELEPNHKLCNTFGWIIIAKMEEEISNFSQVVISLSVV